MHANAHAIRRVLGAAAAVLLVAVLGGTADATTITVDAFVTRHDGDHVDFDGFYGAQCWDLFAFYNRDVVGAPAVNGNAHELYDNAPTSHYTKLGPTATPTKGDIAIWTSSVGDGFGHVAIVLRKVDASTLRVFDQNAPVGSASTIGTFSTAHLRGYLRPKNLAPADTDGDGVVDSKDRCPTKPGPAKNGGCPYGDDRGVARTNPDGTLSWFLGSTASIGSWGQASDQVVVGDWNGDGADERGVVRDNPDGTLTWYLGTTTTIRRWGRTTDRVIVGDWNGDGADERGVVRDNPDGTLTWFLGATTTIERWGRTTDRIIVGDWDGDGADERGVVRDNADGTLRWMLGATATHARWGQATDRIITGDWDGDGADERGVARANADDTLRWMLGATATIDAWGRASDQIVIGDWNGDGADERGVVRDNADGTLAWFLGATRSFERWGRTGDEIIVGDWDG